MVWVVEPDPVRLALAVLYWAVGSISLVTGVAIGRPIGRALGGVSFHPPGSRNSRPGVSG